MPPIAIAGMTPMTIVKSAVTIPATSPNASFELIGMCAFAPSRSGVEIKSPMFLGNPHNTASSSPQPAIEFNHSL